MSGVPFALHVMAHELLEADDLTEAEEVHALGERLRLLVPQVEEMAQDALDVERLHRERDDAVLRIGVLEAELAAAAGADPAAVAFARRERAFTLAAGGVNTGNVTGLLRLAQWIAGEAGAGTGR